MFDLIQMVIRDDGIFHTARVYDVFCRKQPVQERLLFLLVSCLEDSVHNQRPRSWRHPLESLSLFPDMFGDWALLIHGHPSKKWGRLGSCHTEYLSVQRHLYYRSSNFVACNVKIQHRTYRHHLSSLPKGYDHSPSSVLLASHRVLKR